MVIVMNMMMMAIMLIMIMIIALSLTLRGLSVNVNPKHVALYRNLYNDARTFAMSDFGLTFCNFSSRFVILARIL